MKNAHKILTLVFMIAAILATIVSFYYYDKFVKLKAEQQAQHLQQNNSSNTQIETIGEYLEPDRALAIVTKHIKDTKIKLFSSYRISITRKDEIKVWIIKFVGMPESADYELNYSVADSGVVQRIK